MSSGGSPVSLCDLFCRQAHLLKIPCYGSISFSPTFFPAFLHTFLYSFSLGGINAVLYVTIGVDTLLVFAKLVLVKLRYLRRLEQPLEHASLQLGRTLEQIDVSFSLVYHKPFFVIPFRKDSANEWNGKEKQDFSFHCRVQPILSKDSANRRQYKINLLIFIVEAQPVLSKDSANEWNGKDS